MYANLVETAGSMDATELAKVFGRHLLRAGDTPIEPELVDTVVEIFLSLVREAACAPLL
jgi:hypothetical protein